MNSLWSLSEKLDVGNHVAWLGEKAGVSEHTYPKEVKRIKAKEDRIRVDAKGIHGGSYYYWVDEAGNNEAYFLDPNKEEPRSMGAVIFAEITDTSDPVAVKRGYYDNR